MIKKTSQVGSKVIRARAKAVAAIGTRDVKQTIKDLTDSMRAAGLVGMAAPQIGKGLRIFVTEARKTKFRKDIVPDPLRVFINPKITKKSSKQVGGYEGCGSVASAALFGIVKRPESVSVQAYDEKGKKFNLEAKGLLSRIIQHEMDHLDGVVFLDRISDTRSLMERGEYLSKKKSL